jgi:hypothetical protein
VVATGSAALGFQPLPAGFFLALVFMVACYLALIEAGKRWFYRTATVPPATRTRAHGHRINRRASRFSTGTTVTPRHWPRRHQDRSPRSAARSDLT